VTLCTTGDVVDTIRTVPKAKTAGCGKARDGLATFLREVLKNCANGFYVPFFGLRDGTPW
jgi:hypothetical protein